MSQFAKFAKECTCWAGYKRVPGTKPCSPGSCEKDEGSDDKKTNKKTEKKSEDKPCKPAKGKASAKRVDGKCVSYGQAGVTPGKKGSPRQKAFCARHADNNGPAGKAAKKRWNC